MTTATMTTESITEGRLAETAHLLRRAGLGSTRGELEAYASRPYADVVEELLHPDRAPEVPDDILSRYFTALVTTESPYPWVARWVYRMATTQRPLQEKMALFWHHVFATAWFKLEHGLAIEAHVDMLRREGLSNFRTLLLELSKDPAMIFWLDNCENHADAPNENYGREILELFSMGIGNYSETDIKNAAYAFTGWTFRQPIPLYPHGGFDAKFLYRPEDHDDSEKQFLGVSGRLQGEDIIDEIVRHEGTARFIARHLYNFFVADEPQVPAWSIAAAPRSRGDRDDWCGPTRSQQRRHPPGDAGAAQLRLLQGGALRGASKARLELVGSAVFKLTEELARKSPIRT